MLKPFFLFDSIKRKFNVKNDAELARQMQFSPPQISKVRNGCTPCNDSMILRVHETYGVPVPMIREALATPDTEAA